MDQPAPPAEPEPVEPAPADAPQPASSASAAAAPSPVEPTPADVTQAAWSAPAAPAAPPPVEPAQPAWPAPASAQPPVEPPAAAPAWVTTPPPPPGQPAVMWAMPTEPVGPAPGVEFAPHGTRLVAYIIDTIIVSILVGALVVIGTAVLLSGTTIEGNEVTAVSSGASAGFLLLLLVAGIVGFLYFPFFWSRGGQTLGMMPFGLRVVRDRDGSRIGWGTSLLRLIGLWVASAVIYIGLIWIFIDKRRRGWQDLIAGTIVIKQP